MFHSSAIGGKIKDNMKEIESIILPKSETIRTKREQEQDEEEVVILKDNAQKKSHTKLFEI